MNDAAPMSQYTFPGELLIQLQQNELHRNGFLSRQVKICRK